MAERRGRRPVAVSESEYSARPARTLARLGRGAHRGRVRLAAILRSNADGSGWDVRAFNADRSRARVSWVLVDQRRKIAVAVEARGEMQVSNDDGVSWQVAVISIAARKWPFWQGTVSGKRRRDAGRRTGRKRRAQRRCARWRPSTRAPTQDLFGSFANETTGTLFLAGAKGTLLRSTDLGVSWRGVDIGHDPGTAPDDARPALGRAAVFRHARHASCVRRTMA